MNLFTSLDISSSALTAHRYRMNLIASNIANVNTTRTAAGGPYQRQDATLAPQPIKPKFEDILRTAGLNPVNKVKVIGTFTDKRPPNAVYDPSHPDANAEGIVSMPNVNVMEEMGNLLSTLRAYEANITVIDATKDMIKNTLKI